MTELQALALICRDCGEEFIYAKGERAYFEARGFTPPTRCRACRKLAKQQRLHGPDYTSHVERER